jgi:hypothetical protein
MIDEDFSRDDRLEQEITGGIEKALATSGWLRNSNDRLEHEVMVLKARVAELEREQNSPDYRTLIRFPTAECSVL